ncbi:DNA-directed polymerase [Niveomyces insectorum RCEF 264]|uniref:DNA polymerase kappa n=1 Tax=Niveomyces insectorum RCEF 264 TaxID=1081102 RepID=A0A167VDE3_9HYPO|nr:DNA-directed polymerase [Niveomyces insectorum RCEF 264]
MSAAVDAEQSTTDVSRRKEDEEPDVDVASHETLKYSLLGPSLLKAGQNAVDQTKVSDIIYNASRGSKYFDREEQKDKILSSKIEHILAKKARLERLDLSHDLRLVDALLAQLDSSRDLSQYIVHVDCDAFYAAVELLDRPGLAKLVLLKPDFTKYIAKAQEVREILAQYDPRFESASIDEAYLNLTEYCTVHGVEPAAAVARMREEIAENTKVTVSAGIAANTRLAKICSNINKPNGQYVLRNDRTTILEFMNTLPCRKVNGVGRVFERELLAVGIRTTKVQPAVEYDRKSVGTESTFASISDPDELRRKLQWTAGELEKDLRSAACKGRTLVLKIKLHTFEVYTRQVVTARAIQSAEDLYSHAVPMLAKLEQDMPGLQIRLMGLRCTHLVSTKKPDTFAFFGVEPPERSEPQTDYSMDAIPELGHAGWVLDGKPKGDESPELPEESKLVSSIRTDAKTDPQLQAHQLPSLASHTLPAPQNGWNCPKAHGKWQHQMQKGPPVKAQKRNEARLAWNGRGAGHQWLPQQRDLQLQPTQGRRKYALADARISSAVH